ncbi:copper homeostasis protein CutC [Patiriisocius hiemis]|uniref:PF03932 family protein CutC n=1 Tax=Patiriisocius hiemis TaxID=3075604 RepID=A0ABU2YBW1_9FLAO|nr:copper homeostasis protein CutC [Constantimarinum sp. W242]MDT0555676.1 copper homeostasis protein CutC [Constantimarinum sp. W242]
MVLEVCANSFTSAEIAQKAGANRIELCEELSIGGVTPDHATILKVKEQLTIPTHVLIRPRGGNFVYTSQEIDQMLEDIQYCRNLGCEGIVSGALTKEGRLAIKTTQLLIEASKGMEFTFHRAFDICTNPATTIYHLLDMGVTRLLSSGQKNKAVYGIAYLKSLQELTKDSLQIMPGGGITSENILSFKKAGFTMAHFSAIKKESDSNTMFNSAISGFSDSKEIQKIKHLVAS